MNKEVITFKGYKILWDKFTLKAKKNKEQIWDVLEPELKRYIKGSCKSENVNQRR